MTTKSTSTKKITVLAMLSALAYVVMAVGRLPITSVEFLKYDPKDIVIVIGGFLFGPMASLIISTLVSFIEAITVSTTGPIGFIMNVLASVSFACTASFIYKKNPTIKSAVLGLSLGTIMMTVVMILWNYLLVPMYSGTPREEVVKMLVPVFLPFNLLKGGLNAAFSMVLYKPIVTALRKSGFVEERKSDKKFTLGVAMASSMALVSFILFALVMRGDI